MLLGRAAIGCGHCIEKKSAQAEVDDRSTGDAHSTYETGAWQITCHQRRAKIALPNDAAIDRVKCVDIIRFGHRNDCLPVKNSNDAASWIPVTALAAESAAASVSCEVSEWGLVWESLSDCQKRWQ